MESKRLRPVLFKIWIPPQYEIEHGKQSENIIDGTNCWSDFSRAGVFHCWAQSMEPANLEGFYFAGGNTYTVGIIEDKFGHVHEVKPNYILFTDV
jgi:hypothetical protein